MSDTRVITSEFEYYEPTSIEEALSFMETNNKTIVTAGGTDIIVDLKTTEIDIDFLVNIEKIERLNHITEGDEKVSVGSTTTLFQIENSDIMKKNFSILTAGAKEIGSPQVRNMGTIGGNICNGSPCASTAPPLLTLNAKVKLESKKKQRIVSLKEFFVGPNKTAVKPNEILTEIKIPYTDSNGSAYKEIKRVSEDLAKINVATLLKRKGNEIEYCRIGLGSVAPTPIRARKTEKLLEGEEFSKKLVEEKASKVAEEISPITDVRSTKDYRKKVAPRVVKDCIIKAYEESRK